MTERCIYKLKVNENFKRLITPLSSEELLQLEQSIIRDGCCEPLCTWYNTIIDGHNRYEICTRLQIPFAIRRIYFKNHEEAVSWICANQLCRSNITDEIRRYLIGKRYEMEKIIDLYSAAKGNKYNNLVKISFSDKSIIDINTCRASERLGKEYCISYATVEKYGIYAHSLDKLSKITPELIPKILSGQVKISHEKIIELSQLSPQEIINLSNHISDEIFNFIGYSGIRKVLPKKQEPFRKLASSHPIGSVKNMPIYDPDAEISSLILTIPSWVSSINRTRSTTNIGEISEHAKCRLEKELSGLNETINTMLMTLKEEI